MPLIFDLETDNLLDKVTQIHCICAYDTETNTSYVSNNQKNQSKHILPLSDMLDIINATPTICGHNIIKYDIPVIQKLYSKIPMLNNCYDTLVISKVVYPDIGLMDYFQNKKGKHPKELIGKYSLEAFGYRLGMLKGNYGKREDAWSCWTQEMQDYCMQDVKVTTALYNKLQAHNLPQDVIDTENKFCAIIAMQERHGVRFDLKAAQELLLPLQQKENSLKEELQKAFPDKISIFIPKVNSSKFGYVKDVPVEKRTPFNPGSGKQIAERLIEKYNWKPVDLTDSGEVSTTAEVLESLTYPEIKLLLEYQIVNKLIGALKTGKKSWLNFLVGDRIYGTVNTGGAVTGRCTHSNPNLAQVPKVGSPFGTECRALYTAKDGYTLVGCDASGLEFRCFAHYVATWDKSIIDTVLNGKKEDKTDIHSLNAARLKITDREIGKRFLYAFMYGAGNEKLGSIAGGDEAYGKKLRKNFLDAFPALNNLLKAVKLKVEQRGYLIGLDGRKLKVRGAYKALNVLLQSAGAIVMKKALCILYDDLCLLGWQFGREYAFVLNIHDEIQAEVLPECVEQYKILAVNAIRKAGEFYNMNCPLDGEAKDGKNWAETH